DGAPLPGAVVTVASGNGAAVAEVRTNGDGEWRTPLYGTVLDDNVLVALVRADGYAEGRATFEVNLRSPEVTTLRAGPVQTWEATSRRLATLRLAEQASVASVSGRVVDAVTGEPVAKIPLSLQAGWNASVGDAAVGAAETGETGEFTFTATKAGMYTVTAASTDRYGGARFPAFLTGAGDGRAVGVVGPPVAAGQMRASLTWGADPGNLDLHVSAPLKGGIAGEDGTGQYHLWADEPGHPDHVDASEQEAWMERTDADGQGPETAWIASVADRGDVRLSVFDDDNRSDADSTALGDAGAVLQVWFGEDTPRYWTVSPGEAATLWHPVAIDAAALRTYSVEAYSFGADPADPAAF
ncbi:MAG: hypothetical protein ACK4YP_10260, partial [Myxococcota bacterium]